MRNRNKKQKSIYKLQIPWKGWHAPSIHERTLMKKRCGSSKCFLGPNKSYPICRSKTCKVSKRGVYAAFVRASAQGSYLIREKADKILRTMHK